MKRKLYQIKSFLSYINRAGHCSGHGVHSPFAFNLITNVIECKHPYYVFPALEFLRKELLHDKSEIFVSDYGTGSSGKRIVSQIAARSLKSKKEAQLLFRLAHSSKPINIVELGTSLGLTTAYLASVDSRINCYSLEACPELLNIAALNLRKHNINNVTLVNGDIKNTLPLLLDKLPGLGFVFFDANHTEEATLDYFELCLQKINVNTVFVFDDIHSSKGMESAWKKIIFNPKVRVSLDLFSFGIVYFDMNLKKQHYIYLKK